MSILVYFSSAGGSREDVDVPGTPDHYGATTNLPVFLIKQKQNEIFQFLDGKKIIYHTKDITISPEIKEEMRKKVGNQAALPPQVFNKDKYCGDYNAFFSAVEDGKPEKFFGL